MPRREVYLVMFLCWGMALLGGSVGAQTNADKALLDQLKQTTLLRRPPPVAQGEGSNANLFLPYSYYATNLFCTIYSHLDAVAVADFNGDGRNDVALTTSYQSDAHATTADDGALFIFYQDAQGRLGEPVRYATAFSIQTREHSLAAGDVNGDGRADIVLGNYDNLQVFTQTLQGTMQASLLVSTPDAVQVVVGDVNGDGRMDVVSLGHELGEVTFAVWRQTAQGQLGTPQRVRIPRIGGGMLALGDMNGDKKLDVVVLSSSGYDNPDLQVFLQAGGGTFAAPDEYAVDDLNCAGIAIGDVTGDGLDDAVVTYGGNRFNPPYPGLAVLSQNTNHTLNAPVKYDTLDAPQAVALADVNNDGRLDVVTTHYGWINVGVYVQGTNGQLQPEELFPIPYNPNGQNIQGLAVADINNDGQKDILVVDNYQRDLVLLYHQTPGEIPPDITLTAPNGGENLVPGSNVQIKWTASSSVKNVRIAYSIDGLNFISLTPSTPNTGSFTWQIPDRGTSKGIVRIFDVSGRAWDTNDDYFNLQSCQVTLTPLHTYFDKGVFGYALVSTGANCAWEAKPGADWININFGRTGQGNGIIRFDYTSSQNPEQRTSTLTVGNAKIPITIPGRFTSVDAARYQQFVAPESIVAGFGAKLAPGLATPTTLPLPTTLLGTTVKVKDRYNVERLAPLFYVSPTQINYQVPAGTAIGAALVTVTTAEGTVSLGTIFVQALAYGIFSADATGTGPAAAYAVRVKGTTQTIVPTVRYDATQKQWVNIPIDLEPPDEEVVLVLHGTGLRFHNPALPVQAVLWNELIVADYAGPQGYFVGLDQINVRLPKTLRGRGETSVGFYVDGGYANSVTVNIK